MVKRRLRFAHSVMLRDPKHGWLPALMLLLTVVSGLIDATSILSLGHVFVANMTGNLAFTAFALADAPGFSLSTSLTALVAFGVGVTLWRFAFGRRELSPLAQMRAGTIVEAVLLGIAAVVFGFSGADPGGAVQLILAVLCAVALGVQNAMAVSLSVAELTTTVMTRTLVGLVSTIGARGRGDAAFRQFASMVTLVIGACAGAAIVRTAGPAVATGAAALGVLIAFVIAVVADRSLTDGLSSGERTAE